jgi:hypothetical protein
VSANHVAHLSSSSSILSNVSVGSTNTSTTSEAQAATNQYNHANLNDDLQNIDPALLQELQASLEAEQYSDYNGQYVPIPLPNRVPIHRKDTHFKYASRVYKANVRSLRSIYMAEHQENVRQQQFKIQQEFERIYERKMKNQARKSKLKAENKIKFDTARQQRATEILKEMEENKQSRVQTEAKLKNVFQRRVLQLQEEYKQTLVKDGDQDIKPSLFYDDVTFKGWWPKKNTNPKLNYLDPFAIEADTQEKK